MGVHANDNEQVFQRKKSSLEKGEIKQNKIIKVRNQIKDGKNYANSPIHTLCIYIYFHIQVSHKLYIVSSIYVNGESFTFCHGAMYFATYRLWCCCWRLALALIEANNKTTPYYVSNSRIPAASHHTLFLSRSVCFDEIVQHAVWPSRFRFFFFRERATQKSPLYRVRFLSQQG